MNYKKTSSKSTHIENITDQLCYNLNLKGFKYERFNKYVPRYITVEGDNGEIEEILNTDKYVGTGYALIKVYYEDKKFVYVYICCHLVDCETCTYNRFVTVYNYTDDITDTNILGDIPILACKKLPEDTTELDPTTLYYNVVPFTPISANNSELSEHSAYYMYMDNYRDSTNALISFNTYSKNIKPITGDEVISGDYLYVKYIQDKESHLEIKNSSDPNYKELEKLEFYQEDYVDTKGDNIPLNVITDISNIESSITNYAEHCIKKTFFDFNDVNGILNFILYKDKNLAIFPLDNTISLASAKYYIDYSFTDNTYNTFELNDINSFNIACDYSSLDVHDSENENKTKECKFISSVYTSNNILLNHIFNSSTEIDETKSYKYISFDNIIVNNKNLDVGTVTKKIPSIDQTRDYYNLIIIPEKMINTDVSVIGEITLNNFNLNDTSWKEIYDLCKNTDENKIPDSIELILYPIHAEDADSFNLLTLDDEIFRKELPFNIIKEYVKDETPDSKKGFNEEIYKTWDNSFVIKVNENNHPIVFNLKSDNLQFAMELKVYNKNHIEIWNEDTTNPETKINFYRVFNKNTLFSFDFILTNGINTEEEVISRYTENDIYKILNIPYVKYISDGVDNKQINENSYNYYSNTYSDYIKSFVWYNFDENNYIDILHPDTYEIHEEYKNKFFNIISKNEFKSIYEKHKDLKKSRPENAFRITCPECEGKLIDDVTKRCRKCAGSKVEQHYYYYKCNEFKDVTQYEYGHAPETDLNIVPDFNDIPNVKINRTDPITQEIVQEEINYGTYGVAKYYNIVPKFDENGKPIGNEFLNAIELLKYNTVLYKFNGDVNKYYYWNGEKHINVMLGYNYIYKTKTVTKNDLIIDVLVDRELKQKIGSNAIDTKTLKVKCNNNDVLYKVLPSISDIDDMIGFYGYNIGLKKYERIYLYNKHVFNTLNENKSDFNFFILNKYIIDADNHIETIPANYIEEEINKINISYIYKYLTTNKISFDNLNFEIEQKFV